MVHAIGIMHFIYMCHKYLLHMSHSCLRQIDKLRSTFCYYTTEVPLVLVCYVPTKVPAMATSTFHLLN